MPPALHVRPSAVHDQPGSAAFRGFRTEEVGFAGDSLVEEERFEPIVANLPQIAVGTVHRVFRQPADPGHLV